MAFTTSLPTVLDALRSKSAPVYAIPLTGQAVGDKGVKFITKSLLKERSFSGVKSPYHPIELCDFSSCALTDSCLNNIAKIIDRIKTLKELKLNSNGFVGTSQEAASFFEALSNNTSITSIHLSNNDLSGENVMNSIVSCLRRNRTAFRTFNLHTNPIGDDGLVILSTAFALQRHNIRVVNLSRCDIGDEGFAAFASALKTNKTIDEAVFHHNDIGDEGMYVFADVMETNSTLTKIDLRHNNISDRAVAKLTPVIIEKNNSLNSVQLENNNLYSMYLLNKLYDHVDRNNIGVFKREEERIKRERAKREELKMIKSGSID